MTLCVAAACSDRGQNKIVIGTDWKAGSETATAEIQDKLYWITPFWPAIIAGEVSKALELIYTYRELLVERAVAGILQTRETALVAIKEGPLRQKRKFAHDYTMRTLGIPYEDFLAKGKSQLDEGVFRRMLHEIDEIDLGCYLIIPIFVGDTEFMYKVNRDGTIEYCENFVAIGTGDTVAEASLFYRKHECNFPLKKAVYNVYEAMKQGGMIAPEVGREMTISVLAPQTLDDKHLPVKELTDSGYSHLLKMYKRYGPKSLDSRYKFDRDTLLESLEWEPEEGKSL